MSISGPSPLGTLMVQRVEAALGSTLSQQANIASGARPDAVSQPGQPDKVDPAKNPPPKEHEGGRRANEQGGRQAGLAALAKNDPEIAKLLAARNAPMTGYTASAPTSLGHAAKTILALLQQFPQARAAVAGRAPLLPQVPNGGNSAGTTGAGGSGNSSAASGGQPGTASSAAAGSPATSPGAGGSPTTGSGQADQRAIDAPQQRQGDADATGRGANADATARASTLVGTAGSSAAHSSNARTAGLATPLPPGFTASAATAGTSPGMPMPTGMAGQLIMALSSAMQGSGLFYEAHLRDFAFGQRSLEQLQSEPQANVGKDASTARGAGADAAPSRGGAEAVNYQTATNNPAATLAQQSGSAALSGALLGLDPSTHALVRQQLETLANQNFAWQGEAWPGADLEWEVQRRDAQGGEDAPDHWATTLKLHLPGLGEVQARLSLAGSQLIMHLVSPDAAGTFAEHTESLRDRLTAHGLQLSQLTVAHDANAVPLDDQQQNDADDVDEKAAT